MDLSLEFELVSSQVFFGLFSMWMGINVVIENGHPVKLYGVRKALKYVRIGVTHQKRKVLEPESTRKIRKIGTLDKFLSYKIIRKVT